MKRKILIIAMIFLLKLEIVNGLTMKEVFQIDKGIIIGNMKMFGPFITDVNNNSHDELVINGSTNDIYFYEFEANYNFNLVYTYSDSDLIWTSGIGDLDNDGLKDMLIRNTTEEIIGVLEQPDSASFFNTLVWQSDTVFKSIYHLGITDKLKGDEVDRIYGAGIPWLTTPTKGYGWYYFTCTGDNQYEILNTFEESTRVYSTMDIGYLDNDSLIDVVISTEPSVNIYEEINTSSDSFDLIFARNVDLYGAPLSTLILPDIDKDGRNEYIQYCVNYLGPPNSYGYAIMEDTSGTGVYDAIWRRDFEVETDYILNCGGDIDYGDVDGDSLNELVICGGRHVEVWESIGDNQFEMVWEYTDPTYKTIQSHIKCHDFNKNGYDEIIFSGCGQSAGDECTRIFEMKRWSMEGETLVIGNSEEGDTIRKDLVIRNESDGEINIDSMKISSAYFGLTTMTWPLTINGNDSAEVEVWFKGDSTGRYFDSMEVYADRSMTMEYLRAGNGLELRVDSIKAFDGMNPISGIDEDDIVVFYFDWGTNKPDINAGNIDSLLRLSGGDEWDIAGEGIELTKWLSYPGGDRFYVYFDASGKIPTVKVGDTVYTDSQTVIGTWCGERWKRPVVITGSFGPEGIWDSTCTVPTKSELQMQIQNQYIIWNTNTQGTLIVYDISGREVIREESKATGTHKTDIRQLKNGIYFIKLHTENQSITEKMVRIK